MVIIRANPLCYFLQTDTVVLFNFWLVNCLDNIKLYIAKKFYVICEKHWSVDKYKFN